MPLRRKDITTEELETKLMLAELVAASITNKKAVAIIDLALSDIPKDRDMFSRTQVHDILLDIRQSLRLV